jgi:hypothetical protein
VRDHIGKRVADDHAAVFSMEGGVTIEDRLDVVLAGRETAKALDGIAEDGIVEDRGGSGTESFDVGAEERLRRVAVHRVESRLRVLPGGEEKENASVHRLGFDRGRHHHLDSGSSGLGRGRENEGENRRKRHGRL